jgi:molybdopterin-binding protein
MFRIKEAAALLGVSTDTLRRWAGRGRIQATTDSAGRQAVDGAALARLAQDLADEASYDQHPMVVAHSMRNRFPGLVTRVVRDTVMAQVEIQAGPHRFVSLVSREAADELGLEPGMLTVAAVKSTSISVEIPASELDREVTRYCRCCPGPCDTAYRPFRSAARRHSERFSSAGSAAARAASCSAGRQAAHWEMISVRCAEMRCQVSSPSGVTSTRAAR